MIEIKIKMDSPNANLVSPNKNDIQLDYTVEVGEKSTFEEKVTKIIWRYLEARRKTDAYILIDIANYCDDVEIYIRDKGIESKECVKYRITSHEAFADESERAYRAVMEHLNRLIREGEKRDE